MDKVRESADCGNPRKPTTVSTSYPFYGVADDGSVEYRPLPGNQIPCTHRWEWFESSGHAASMKCVKCGEVIYEDEEGYIPFPGTAVNGNKRPSQG